MLADNQSSTRHPKYLRRRPALYLIPPVYRVRCIMIRFENVGMRYGMGPEVLRDVSFHIAPGSFQFLTGPSGAGKTSLLKLIFLARRPSRGLISMFGHDVATTTRSELPVLRRRIGVVFQPLDLRVSHTELLLGY